VTTVQGKPQAILLESSAELSPILMLGGEILADLSFEAEIIEWRGPAPFYFVAVPSEHVDEVLSKPPKLRDLREDGVV